MTLSLRSTVPLANGVAMPWLGLGTFKSSAGGEVEQAIRWALEIAYRSIDTAAAIFDFEIAPADMAWLDGLDRNRRIGPDPDHFSF